MANRKPSWPLWVTTALLLPMLYVLSYGPVAWLGAHSLIPESILSPIVIGYWPLAWTINSDESPRWLHDGIIWYLNFWG